MVIFPIFLAKRYESSNAENMLLREELSAELKNKKILEKRLENVSVGYCLRSNANYPPKAQMRTSMQKFNELTTSTIDYNKVVREKFAEKEEALAEREAAVCP